MLINKSVEAFTQTLKAHAKNIGKDTKITETSRRDILVYIITDFMHYCDTHRIDYDGIFEEAEAMVVEEQKKRDEEDKKNALIWLQSNEETGVLACGCKLTLLDSDPAFVLCEKHKKVYWEG